jgi:integrase/recombinase XerC
MPSPIDIQLQAFHSHLAHERRYSVHTVRAYMDDLRDFTDYLLSQYELSDASCVEAFHVRSWLSSLAEAGISPRSINRKLSSLRSFYVHGRRTGVFRSNPVSALKALKVSRRLPSFVEKEQLDRLFRQVAFPEGLQGDTERLILELLYQTGVRVSELLSIRPEDVHPESRALKVLGKGNKERIIPLGDPMLGRIAGYLKRKEREGAGATEGYLLETSAGRRMNPRQAYAIVRGYLSRVTTSESKGPHALRHSFATHLADNGAELNAVKELLGHSSLAATQVYTHNSIGRLLEAYRKAHPKG